MSEKYLKLSTVAEMLDISRTHVYQLAMRGEIPTVRLGRAIRVPASRLEEVLAQRSAAGV